MDNNERAEWGAKAIPAGNPDHEDSMESNIPAEGLTTSAADTVANILHHVVRHGGDVAAVIRMAVSNFKTEVMGTDPFDDTTENLKPSDEFARHVRGYLMGEPENMDAEEADGIIHDYRLLIYECEQGKNDALAAAEAASHCAELSD